MSTAVRTVHDFVNGETPDASVWDSLAKGWQLAVGADAPIASIGTTETIICGDSFTALTSRVFRISFSADVVGTVAGDLAQARILWDGANTVDRLTGWATVRTDDPVTISKSWLLTLSAGSHLIQLQVARKDGTGLLTAASSSSLTVVDEGSLA